MAAAGPRKSKTAGRGARPNLIGHSPAFRRLLEQARQVARTGADVLIEAESGTGKELVARLIHRGKRAPRGAICGRELLGVSRSSARERTVRPRARRLHRARTRPSPENSSWPTAARSCWTKSARCRSSLQPKLLRVLQEREVDPLGGTRTVPLDVRVIATTNRPLRASIAAGEFRADLYYRLNVVPLTIPPLRERREDILELAEHFLRKHAPSSAPVVPHHSRTRPRPRGARLAGKRSRAGKLHSPRAGAFDRLVCSAPNCSRTSKLRPATQPARPRSRRASPCATPNAQLLERTLEATGGNRTRAAELMGVSLRTVRNKIRNYGLPARRIA